MKKDDKVVELGDEAHVGVFTGARKGSSVLVRWNPRNVRWHRESDLRLATPQEIENAQPVDRPVVPRIKRYENPDDES